MKGIYFILILLYSIPTVAQLSLIDSLTSDIQGQVFDKIYIDSIKLPDLAELIETYYSYTMAMKKVDIDDLEFTGNVRWFDYLPSIGTAYTPAGALRPSVSFSPIRLLQIGDRKKTQKRKIQSLTMKYDLLVSAGINEIIGRYRDLQRKIFEFEVQKDLVKYDVDILAISEAKELEALITPSQLLAQKKSYHLTMAALEVQRNGIIRLIDDLIIFSHYHVF